MFDKITYTTPPPTANNKLQQQSRQIEKEKQKKNFLPTSGFSRFNAPSAERDWKFFFGIILFCHLFHPLCNRCIERFKFWKLLSIAFVIKKKKTFSGDVRLNIYGTNVDK